MASFMSKFYDNICQTISLLRNVVNKTYRNWENITKIAITIAWILHDNLECLPLRVLHTAAKSKSNAHIIEEKLIVDDKVIITNITCASPTKVDANQTFLAISCILCHRHLK